MNNEHGQQANLFARMCNTANIGEVLYAHEDKALWEAVVEATVNDFLNTYNRGPEGCFAVIHSAEDYSILPVDVPDTTRITISDIEGFIDKEERVVCWLRKGILNYIGKNELAHRAYIAAFANCHSVIAEVSADAQAREILKR